MTPKEIIERALTETFQDAAGQTGAVELAPPLTVAELEIFQGHQPGPLSADVRELLQFTRGFILLGECVDFRGEIQSEFAPALACGIPIYSDRFGSFWMVHVNPSTGEWAPVFFTSEDPPVLVIQSSDLVDFLDEWFNAFRPGRASALDQVYQVALDIWRHNGGLLRVGEVRHSPDPALRVVAEHLKDDDHVADLRSKAIGSGFAWKRHDSHTLITCHGPDLLFALEAPERPPGFFHRLMLKVRFYSAHINGVLKNAGR